MNALALSEDPLPQAPIDPLVAALLLTDPSASVVARTDGSALVRIGEPGSAHTHALLVDGRDLDFLEQAVEAAEVKPGQTLHVVAVGGDASAAELLKRLIKPAMLQLRASKHAHLWTPGGKLETVRGLQSAAIAKAVKRLESGETIDLAAVTREREGQSADAQRFLAPLMKRTPWVTWTVAAVSVVLFGLQMWWGNGEAFAAAARMGAGMKGLIGEGQLYRLLTPTLLHGSVPHLVLNVAALFSFGTFLERLLGWRRYLALYVASGLGGGIASFFHREEVLSVGASGGIWGLMVAGAVLVTLPRGKLPHLVVAAQRNRAWAPVVINGFYSFQPGIDILAHLGGGLTGALLVASGLLTAGIPDAAQSGDPERPPMREGLLVKALGVLCTLALVASLAAAFAQGRPWELRGTPPTHAVALGDDPFTLQLPTLLAYEKQQTERGSRQYSFGALRSDPIAVLVLVPNASLDPAEAGDPEGTAQQLLNEVKLAPLEGFHVTQGYTVQHHEAQPYLEGRLSADDGRRATSYYLQRGDKLLNLLVFEAKEATPEWRALAAAVPFTLRSTRP